jgi:hypothetical protein
LIYYFGGFTEVQTKGGYLLSDGSTAIEEGVCFIVVCDDDEAKRTFAHQLAREFAGALEQESVLLTEERVLAHFVS